MFQFIFSDLPEFYNFLLSIFQTKKTTISIINQIIGMHLLYKYFMNNIFNYPFQIKKSFFSYKQKSIDNSDNISENNKKTTSPESIKQEIQKMNTENLNSKDNNNDNFKSKTNQIDENTTDEDTDFEDERRKRLKTEKVSFILTFNFFLVHYLAV